MEASPSTNLIALRRCHHCGVPVERCDRCGLDVELIEGGYGLVKVDGHPGLKILCIDCFDGLVEFIKREGEL